MSPLLATLLFLLQSSLLHRTSTACHPDDHYGLLSFKSGITEDPTGILSSWVPATNCCSWTGVLCGSNSRVIKLSVIGQLSDPGSYLSGTISSSLSKLLYMTDLFLAKTRNITGPFPTFLSTLPELRSIYLFNNRLSGPIPSDIGARFANIEILGVSENRFTGRIPISMGQLKNLTQLNLDGNLLTGSIPDEIRQLSDLGHLHLANNRLSGEIPNFFNSLPGVWTLNLSYNKLSGEIPSSISYLTSLDTLDLGNNLLSGQIPNFIGNLKWLFKLDLSANQLTGTVPSTLKNLTWITNLNLGHNKLVGSFPEMRATAIETLDLSYNKFNLGQLPKWVVASRGILSLKLAGCGLKFNLDDFKPMGTFYYNFIDLSDNQISGNPNKLLSQVSDPKEFSASGNQLRFNMSELVIPETLKYLNLSRNQIYGKIPASIAGVDKVDLSHNHLCGQIPKTKLSSKVFLGNDCLCGSPLPACKS